MRHARLPVVLGLVLACMLAGAATRAPAAAPPEWLTRLAAEPTPAYAAGAPALVLFDHDAVRLDGRGRLVLTRRRAVRVLSAGGEEHAQAVITYLSGRDTAKGLGAWLLRGGKEFKPKSQSRGWVDEVIDEDALFSEYRAKTYSCEDIAAPGDVFGFEATVEGGTLFTDQINIWRSDLPALAERYDLTLSSGWTLTARVDGERPLVASRSADGLTWSWVLRDRPYRPDEPYAAEEQWFDARVLTTLQRPAGAAVVPGGPVSFSRWSELSMWNRDLAAGQCDRDPALAENVARLTAGVADPLGRMRALSRHVQQLRYVAVNTDIGIGFGYRPRKATEVHTRGWGDCKDKANLLCAMLREVGITAHLATASVGYGRVISPDWPNPQQFNHAIVAIPVDASVDLPAVVETARLGRVLFFDATDPTTMLGDLPTSLQGSSVFILAEGSDELTILPRLPAEQNRRFERQIELLLTPGGIVAGIGTFSGRGQAGAGLRSLLRRRSAKELEAWVLESLGTPLRGAVLRNVKVEDDPVADEVKIRFELAAPKFCQFLPGNLALVKLDLFTRMGMPAFPNRDRVLPLEFEGMQVVERVEIVLPDRFAAEELPSPVVIEEPFATYENRVGLREGVLGLERILTLRDMTVPATDYARVRQFVGGVAKADKGSAVLRVGAP